MNIKASIQRHPVATYFFLAYMISWVGSFAAGGPRFIRGEAFQPMDSMVVGLLMLAGPSLAGITLTYLVDGRSGLRDLFSRMGKWRVGARWYVAALLIPPVLIVAVLLVLAVLVSPNFAPNFFPLGILLGLMAGFVEEIGWMGYAFPKMQLKHGTLPATILLGVLHGTWHLMAGYLGEYWAYGVYWLPRFLAMWIVAMTAMRVLQVWVYSHTRSVWMIQLMHASSSGFLLVLGPSPISPANETLWFAVYAAVLWVVVAIVVRRYGKDLVRQPT